MKYSIHTQGVIRDYNNRKSFSEQTRPRALGQSQQSRDVAKLGLDHSGYYDAGSSSISHIKAGQITNRTRT